MDELSREIEALGNQDEDIRLRALSRLSNRHDEQILFALMDAIKNENPQIRRGACIALGNRGDIKSAQCLVKFMDDDDPEVAMAALEQLSLVQDPWIINPLIVSLGNIHQSIRRRAAILLNVWGINFAETLADALEKKPGATDLLMQIEDKRIVFPLLKARVSKNIEIRWAAHEVLSRLGDFAVEPFIEALTGSNKKIVIQAAGYLGKLGDSRALPALIQLLKDENVEIRRSCLLALGALGEPSSLHYIKEALEDEEVKKIAVDALGLFGGEAACDTLIILLSHKETAMRESAAAALGNLGDARAIQPLFEIEKSEKDSKLKEIIHTSIEKIIKSTEVYEENYTSVRCSKCFGHFQKNTLKYSFFKKYHYYACEECKSSQGISNLNEVVAVLDRNMEESKRQDSGYLLVNWFCNSYPFTFERLMIKDAEDKDVAEFLETTVKANKNPHFQRAKKDIPVFVFPSCNLSKKTIDKLKGFLGDIEFVKSKSNSG